MTINEKIASWVDVLDGLRDHPLLASFRYGVMWSLVPAGIALLPLYFFVSPEADWNLRIMDAYLASLGLMGAFCALFISQFLSKFYKARCFSGPVALAVYLALLPVWPRNGKMIIHVLRNTFTSGPFVGLFLALVVGGGVVWIRKKWPRVLFLGEAVGLFAGFLMIAYLRMHHLDIHRIIRVFIGNHIWTADSLSAALLLVGTMNFLWFLGLQGSAIIGSFITGVYAQLAFDNMQAMMSGRPAPHIVTMSFLNYVFIGGAGTTVALPCFMLFSRVKKTRILGGASILPVLFNVNESLIYLLPLVLNTYFLIPFLAGPLFTTATTYFAVKYGLIPHFGFYVPGLYYLPAPILAIVTTTPNFHFPRSWFGFHQFLWRIMESGSWKSGLLACAQIAVIALMYYPFFRAFDKKSFIEQQNEETAKLS